MKRIGLLLLAFTMLLGFMPKTAMAAVNTYSEQDLTNYLVEVSNTRGFEATKADINEALSLNDKSTSDFTSIEDLKGVLGDVIKSDFSNLEELYTKYNLDQDTLPALLSEYGDNLKDYIFVKELDTALGFYTESSKSAFSGIDTATLMSMLGQLDLTEQEVQNFKDYYASMSDYLSSAEVEAQLQTLQTKMMAFLEKIKQEKAADENYKPSDAEVKEVVSYYNEILSIMKIKMEFSLVDGDNSTPLSMEELFKLEELKASDLKMKVFDSNGEFLADFIVTSDLIKSLQESIIEDGGDLANQTDVKTVKGGKLPATATNYLPYAFYGLFLSAAGVFLYRKVRNDKVEILEA